MRRIYIQMVYPANMGNQEPKMNMRYVHHITCAFEDILDELLMAHNQGKDLTTEIEYVRDGLNAIQATLYTIYNESAPNA